MKEIAEFTLDGLLTNFRHSLPEMGIVAISTFGIYIFLGVLVRTVGRRFLAQLSAIDLLILLLLGSSVETSMVHGNTVLRMGFVSATVLFLTNRLISTAMLRSKKFRFLVGAGPALLIHDGKFIDENLKRLALTHADVLEALRERECASPEDVKLAVMEPDGSINVVFKDKPTAAKAAPKPAV